MLILTLLKRLGCGALVLGAIAALTSAGTPPTGPMASLERLPGLVGIQIVASHAADKHEPGCSDPYRRPLQGAGAARVISLPCAPEERGWLAIERPGLTLKPLTEPAPAAADRSPQRISF